MIPIVTLTLNPAVDGSAEAGVVRPARKTRTSNERYDPGGGGINVARVIQELGGSALAVYLGGGATGAVLDELLDAHRIPRRRVPIRDHTRVSHAVFERATGLEYRFVPQGPQVSKEEWRACAATLDELAFEWLSGAVELLATTMGHHGALLTTREGSLRLSAPYVQARSTVGAGDSFLGAMTLALAQGQDPWAAFKRGIAAGTAAVLAPGTQLCRREQAERMHERIMQPHSPSRSDEQRTAAKMLPR